MNNKFKVVEIFDSIDGEGIRTGELTSFIRLAGCNLNCSYCDTRYACDNPQYTEVSIEDILTKLKEYGNRNITITGGEPLLVKNIDILLKQLSKLNYNINIETNGSIPLLKKRYKNVFYTMDYKCPSSNMSSYMIYNNLLRLKKNDVLKFVVGCEDDLHFTKFILYRVKIKAKVYISPVWDKINPAEIVGFMKAYREDFINSRIQLQLHKIIWDKNKRGV